MADEQADLYVGRAGQLAVMAEFLARGLNVAEPEVDVGDDLFVVRAADDIVTRVQVKTANAVAQQNQSYVAQFSLPWGQLTADDASALVYVFAVRYRERWSDFLVVRRRSLQRLRRSHQVGSVVFNPRHEAVSLTLRLVLTPADVQNKGASFQPFRGAFMPWPPQLPPGPEPRR